MTFTPSSVTKDSISTPTVYTDRIVLDGVDATAIAREITDDTHPNSLIAASAVSDLKVILEDIQEKLDPHSTIYEDQTVMTVSTVDRFFNKPSEWILKDWAIDTNTLYCLKSSKKNRCRIHNNGFNKPGVYFLSITVTNLPSGLLKVFFNGKLLMSIEKVGHYGFEVEVKDLANDKLYLVAEDLSTDERIAITSMALYYVTPRFFQYLVSKITSMATVDANNFVTKTMFREEMRKYVLQFEQSANMFLDQLKEHTEADNPHHITREMLGAAAEDHVHEQYVDKVSFVTYIEKELALKADKEHEHTQYATKVEIPKLVEDIVGDRFNQITTIPPAIIVLAETGKLPSRFARTEIREPITLLLPSQVNTGVYGNYSSTYGIITTNSTDMIGQVMKVFMNTRTNDGATLPEEYKYDVPLIIRNSFHTKRTIRGYKLYSKGMGVVTSWKVYTGNNTYQHQIDELSKDDTYYFDKPVNTDAITFGLLADNGRLVTGFRIDLLMDEPDVNKIFFTRNSFSLSLPDNGCNRLVTVPKVGMERTLEVEKYADDIPYYFFARYTDQDLEYYGSFIQPEYGETRTGVEVFTNNYSWLDPDVNEIFETYTHPVFGKLQLVEGLTKDIRYPLKAIYDKTTTSWRSKFTSKKVVIEQEVSIPSTMLKGYSLNWREDDMIRIPDTWTLMVTGTDSEGVESTVVVDSVEHFFPCYSVEDDDIIYSKPIDVDLHISKITLTMVAGKDTTKGLALNQLVFFLSEHFYSIPENTFYRGRDKVPVLCLGHYTHDALLGWEPTNLCLGKSVVVPVNDFDETDASSVYTIPNPFLTTSITVTINPYCHDGEQRDIIAGQVLSISATKIEILAITPAVYTATITRSW